jgi:hypothetical protein
LGNHFKNIVLYLRNKPPLELEGSKTASTSLFTNFEILNFQSSLFGLLCLPSVSVMTGMMAKSTYYLMLNKVNSVVMPSAAIVYD